MPVALNYNIHLKESWCKIHDNISSIRKRTDIFNSFIYRATGIFYQQQSNNKLTTTNNKEQKERKFKKLLLKEIYLFTLNYGQYKFKNYKRHHTIVGSSDAPLG